MSIIIPKDQIPVKGDLVIKTIVNKERTLCRLVFKTGKNITFSIDPKSFGINTPQCSPVKKENVLISPTKKINQMDKNTPNDIQYQQKARETLARLTGQSIEEIESTIQPPLGMTQVVTSVNSNINLDTAVLQEDFEKKKEEALERSQQRATRLAEQLSSKAGGKLENVFAGGKSTIELK